MMHARNAIESIQHYSRDCIALALLWIVRLRSRAMPRKARCHLYLHERSTPANAVHYERRRPEQTSLYRLVLDGVGRSTGDEALFHKARPPTRDELQRLLDKIVMRLMRMPTRKGYLIEMQGIT